ncbi:DUF2614 family zinc ribbon-containing protein [Bifidobacterium parmae]|nr:DUF2614 family zinc ribbon-containing protein [Bifidobacterium parmae]
MTSFFLKRYFVHAFAGFMGLLTVLSLIIMLLTIGSDFSALFRYTFLIGAGAEVMIGLTLRELRQRYREISLDQARRLQRQGLSYANVAGDGKNDVGRAGEVLDKQYKAAEQAVGAGAGAASRPAPGNAAGNAGRVGAPATASAGIVPPKTDAVSLYVAATFGMMLFLFGASGVIRAQRLPVFALIVTCVGIGLLVWVAIRDWRTAKALLEERRSLSVRAQHHEEETVRGAVGQYQAHGVVRSRVELSCPNCGGECVTVLGRKVLCAYCQQDLKIDLRDGRNGKVA